MNHYNSEILFALYINGGQATASWLLEFLGDDKSGEAQRHMKELLTSKLITIHLTDGQLSLALTDAGSQMAVFAATCLSDQMLDEWQQTQATTIH